MQRIGRYEILAELGRGAMGAVYKARDPQIGRTVAIKTILTAGLTEGELAQYKQRFYREAQTAGQVNHPGIITIHDIAEDEKGQPYLVMEFVDGVTLHRMLRPGHSGHLPERLPLDQALDLTSQVAEALDFAHRRGVVHRDIKPGNIMITADGRAKIADFGIAKFTDAEATRTTTVLGTPAYMAPEQLRGGNIDARSDIFSLGAMFYWIITGQKPFPGEDLTSVSFKVVYTDPPKPTEIVPDLPRDLDTVASRCLAKNPGDRYQNAKELANDLAAIRAGKRIATTAAPKNADDPTVSTMQVSVASAVSKAAAALAQPMKVAPARPPRTGFVLAGVATALVIVVAYFLWPQERVVYVPFTMPAQTAQPPAKSGTPPQSRSNATRAAKGNDGAGQATAGPAATDSIPVSSAEVRRAAAAKATFEVECNFSFSAATLQVFFGSQKLVDAKLEGKFRVFRSRGGTYRTSGQVPAGPHQVRVRVVSDDVKEPFDQEAVIEGIFAEGAAQKLIVEFPKKQLTLRWAAAKK
jgi:serine/threonine-protein kinase